MSLFGITDFLIGSLLLFGNTTLFGLVATSLKKSPKMTGIFLCNMSVAGMAFGIALLARGFYVFFDVTDFALCQVGTLVSMASCGVYTTNLVYLYIELYLSIKKMTVRSSPISRRSAILASLVGDGCWLLVSTLGLNFIHNLLPSRCNLIHVRRSQ